jgi:thymidine kinase
MKITIEGGISAGKSTILNRIQQETRIPVFLEPVDKWTLIGKFYENIERWSFTFNIEVLLSMTNWKNNSYKSLYERSPLSCRYVFTQMQVDKGQISKEELQIFDKLYKILSWDQDVIIYIKTDPNICFERMNKRNRGCESQVSIEYLQHLDKKHEDMLNFIKKEKTSIKIYTINGNDDENTVYNNVKTILDELNYS